MAFRAKNGNIITTDEIKEMYGHFRKDFPDRCQTFEAYLDRFFRNNDFEEIEVHIYGMRLRGFSQDANQRKASCTERMTPLASTTICSHTTASFRTKRFRTTSLTIWARDERRHHESI